MAIVYVDNSEQTKRMKEALAWIAKGWKYGELECKTICYIPEREEGHHCPACWMCHARDLAKKTLDGGVEKKR